MYLVTDTEVIGRITDLEISGNLHPAVTGNSPPASNGVLSLWVQVPGTKIDIPVIADFWIVDPCCQWASPLVDCMQVDARYLNASKRWELCYEVYDQGLEPHPDEHLHLARIRLMESHATAEGDGE